MHVTRYYNIKKTKSDDWFNTILNTDTPVFVDPFFIFKDTSGFWADAHDQIVQHFERIFLLIAKGNLNPQSLAYRRALSLLEFKEPKELCLGYTGTGVDGAGSGKGFGKSIAKAIVAAIERGLDNPKHFEELGVLSEGIGRDRISDITCTILKPKLISYTQDIAKRHNIPLAKHRVFAAAVNHARDRWETQEVLLPTNPFFNRPLLLVPQRFLNDLPVLNYKDWWQYYEGVKLRDDVNYTILSNVDKETIIRTAQENPDIVRQWTSDRESENPLPYDLSKDPQGVFLWMSASEQFTESNPLTIPLPTNAEEFFGVIELVIEHFKLFVEEQGGWNLLWNEDGKEKHENAPQLLFRGIASNYCKANDISLDAEVNLGRGPVDFKFSNSYRRRAHLEVKKVHNGEFWNGLSRQLPSYMKSDEVSDGWFLAILYRDGGISNERIKDLPGTVRSVASEQGLNLRYALVDARHKVSASKIRR